VSPLLDTSVLVRYLTNDSPELAERSAHVIESADEVTLSDVALVETAWVLERTYGLPRDVVVDSLRALIRRRNVRTACLPKEVVDAALAFCRGSRRVAFADALIWAAASVDSDASVYSFDRRFPASDVTVIRP